MSHIDDLTAKIKEHFVCPVCDGYMISPIHMCKNGHSICNLCFPKLKKCPNCRAAKSDARCYSLEAIASKLKLPCRYHNMGCSFVGMGTEIAAHDIHCKHSPLSCPFRTYDNCNWQGFSNKLKLHCIKKHKNNFYLREKQKFLAKNFRDIKTYHYIYVLIYVYNEYFRLTWDIEENTGHTRWAIYSMGSQTDAKKYSYKIEFPRAPDDEYDDISLNLTWKSPCDVLPKDDSSKFMKHNYLVVHKRLLDAYCEGNGDLNYTVHIYRSNYCDNSSESEPEKECKALTAVTSSYNYSPESPAGQACNGSNSYSPESPSTESNSNFYSPQSPPDEDRAGPLLDFPSPLD